jgi:hypothetical protein
MLLTAPIHFSVHYWCLVYGLNHRMLVVVASAYHFPFIPSQCFAVGLAGPKNSAVLHTKRGVMTLTLCCMMHEVYLS